MISGWQKAFVLMLFLAAQPFPVRAQVNDENARIARLQAQILELEERIRRLTGRLEEAEFGQRRTDQRLDQLIGDIDGRLQVLEPSGQQSATNNFPGTQQAGVPEVTIVRPDGQSRTPAPDVVQGSKEEGVLGTIPRDALLGIPTPSGDGQSGVDASGAGDAGTRYAAIQDVLASGDFEAARPLILGFLQDFPEALQASEASFMLGETWFVGERYPEAAAQFAENVRKFGSDDKRSADNLLKLGMALARLGDNDRACTAFREFDRRYPDAGASLQRMASREKEASACP